MSCEGRDFFVPCRRGMRTIAHEQCGDKSLLLARLLRIISVETRFVVPKDTVHMGFTCVRARACGSVGVCRSRGLYDNLGFIDENSDSLLG